MIKVMHTEYNSNRDIELVCEKVLDYECDNRPVDLDSIYGMAIQWRDNVKRSNWYPQ